MNDELELQRLAAKTPQQRFLQILQQDFRIPPRIAQAILDEGQNCLQGQTTALRPGQIRILLARRNARPGQGLRDTPTEEITWTVDAGAEDRQVQQRAGLQALRQVRIQRLLDEALEQGAVATQEDLAQALHTSVRTIKRDFTRMHAQGQWLATRGYLHEVGRGQTHKGRILARWLQGETYDQLERHTYHCASSIRRYVQAFVQVVQLQRLGWAEDQIAQLLQMGRPLVGEYLAIYAQHDTPACRERLESQLERFGRADRAEKGAR
jgi:hypothetical protein